MAYSRSRSRTPFRVKRVAASAFPGSLLEAATSAQVQSHTAVFSLAGEGEVRTVAMEPFPTEATWTTLKRFQVHSQAYDEKRKSNKIITSFDQRGWVWQAEEKLEGGQWKRYYGFVGHHIVAKVPAEEIELAKPPRPAAQP